MFIDTHAHLYWDSLLPRIDQIILDAKNVWVEKMICIWCHEQDAEKSKEIAEKYENVFFTVWIHPTDINDWIHSFEKINWGNIEKFITHKKCVWIWECGFDFYHKPYDFKSQEKIFVKQIELANKYNKNLVIHSRESWDTALNYLQDFKWKFVFHCFTDTQEIADKVLKSWWYISVWWIITYPKANELREIVKNYPLEKIILETDCPFLAPQSVRWQTNEPRHIPEIALKLSEIKGLWINEIEEITTRNSLEFFGI